MLVDFLHTFSAEVALGNHLHLDLRTLYRVALAYHRTKRTVAAEVTVASNKQIAQVHAVVRYVRGATPC